MDSDPTGSPESPNPAAFFTQSLQIVYTTFITRPYPIF